jgi:hypothetical protein
MKKCLHKDGFFVEPGVFSKEQLRLWSANKLICQYCGGLVRYRHGIIVSPHFSHHANNDCDYWEPETEEHLAGKRMLKSWLENVLPSNETIAEYFVKEIKQRADIMTLYPDGHRLCIEYQCSPVSLELLKKRMEGYEQVGISQVWVLGASLFKGRSVNRFRLRAWENWIRSCQENGLYIFDPERGKSLIYISNIALVRGRKTIVGCDMKVECSFDELGISRNGKIIIPDQGHLGKRESKKKNTSRIRKVLGIPQMSKWIQQVKRDRERDFYRNPLRAFALSRIGEHLSHPVFNQYIEGDHLFLLDHRLWQSYLFLTEIHKIYQRRAVYGTGTKTPTIFINHLLTKDNRFPERPFQFVLDKYVNKRMQNDIRFKKINLPVVKAIHVLIYEYFSKLEMLGFLNNITPSRATVTSAGKMFGKFEVLFDQFCPDIFGETEEDIRAFFQNHSLRYLKNQWYDIRNNPAVPLKNYGKLGDLR